MSKFVTRVGGERFYVFVDGERREGYTQSDEKALSECIEAYFENPEADDIRYKTSKEAVLNLSMMRSALAQLGSAGSEESPGLEIDPNPNGIPLIYSDPLDNPVNSNFFESAGFSYTSDGTGSFVRATLETGEVDGGSMKLAIGATPDSYLAGVADTTKKYDDLEYTIDVRISGAGGDPQKMIRVAGFVVADWTEAFVSHAWEPDVLNLAPVSAIDASNAVVGAGYNDTTAWDDISDAPDNSGWLGNQTVTDNIVDGEWHTLRIRQKLNTVGNADGILWCSIDGVVQKNLTNMNWRKSWDGDYYWNVLLLEHYINAGASDTVNLDFRNLYVRGTGSLSDPTPPQTLGITRFSLPSGYESTAYSQTVTAANGTTPYAWDISAGSLPSGLTINSSTGVISGTLPSVGSDTDYDFTVRVTDDASATATMALTITVLNSAPPSSAWWDEPWNYASTAAMVGASHVEEITSAGKAEVTLSTGITGAPGGFTKAMRCTFFANAGGEPTAGVNLYPPAAGTDRPREIWVEFYTRFSSGWTTVGPYSGNADHKFFFMFDQNPDGGWRWENMVGVFGTNIQVMIGGGGHGIGSSIVGDLWDGSWHLMRYHAKMDSSTGLYTLTIDSRSAIGFTGVDTNRGAGYYFAEIALGRNLNKGASSEQWVEYGPVSVYITDPGW